MKRKIISALSLYCFLSFSLPFSICAASFKILGTRPIGMGGAFVAVAEDALATYWNPAGLGMQKGFDLHLPLNVNLEATGNILKSAKNVADSFQDIKAVMEAQEKGGYINLEQLKAFSGTLKNLKEMEGKGKGFLAEAAGGINTRFGRWAFTVNNFTSIGINPQIDLTNLYLGSGTFSGAPLRTKEAYSSPGNLRGIDLSKFPPSTSTSTPSGLEPQSDDLASVIDVLASKAGVSLGEYSSQQIANALINLARDHGVKDEDIKSAVSQIKDALPIIENILSNTAFKSNTSNLTVSGISLTEFTFSHGRELPYINALPFLDKLYVGVNIKYIIGVVAYMKQEIIQKGETMEFSEISDVMKKNVNTSSNFGIDLGVLWSKEKWFLKPRVGLVWRNLNSPTFKQPSAATDDGLKDYKVDPQMRFGAAIKPFNWWLIASDMDLTKNKTIIDGYESQNISLGNEFNIFNRPWLNLALRSGLIKNIAYGDSPLTYTAGIGLNLIHLVFEVGGAISSEMISIDTGSSIPSRAMVSMTLSLNF